MFPRKALSFRQEFAQPLRAAETGFARAAALRHADPVARLACDPAMAHQDCYPFPSNWPDPHGVGPFFPQPARDRQSDADCV